MKVLDASAELSVDLAADASAEPAAEQSVHQSAPSAANRGLACAAEVSPELFQNIIGAMELGAAVWQLENPEDPGTLRLLAYNAAAERSSGIPWASFLNKTMAEVFPSIVGTPILRQYRDVALSGRSIDLAEQSFTTAHDVVHIYAVRAHGLPNRCVLVTFTNITGQRQIGQDLDRFFELTLHMVCIAGTDGYFKRINPAFERVLGYTQEELLSTPFISFVHPEDVASTLAEAQKLSAGVPTIRFENRYRKKNGDYCWLSWTTAPFGNKLYTSAQDVTEAKRIEADLRETTLALAQRAAEAQLLAESRRSLLEELEKYLGVIEQQQTALRRSEKLAAIGQLAASVGHELRNPLGAVRNAATYLSRRLLDQDGAVRAVSDPKIPQFFDIMERELTMMGKIINDLLDFARERELILQPCPLRSLTEEAISLVHIGAVAVENGVPADLPMPHVDREQLRQVLVNLIQNAVDAIPRERAGRVTISATGGDGAAFVLSIQDNGSGIPQSSLGRIFEPLYTTKLKGTGLGLAIVQSIIRRHRGHITVQSQTDLGTTFTLTIPGTSSISSQGGMARDRGQP